MSEEPSISGSKLTSFIVQLKLKKIPDTPVTEQDFIISQTLIESSEETSKICDIFVKLKSAIAKQNKKEFKNWINHLYLISNKMLIQEYLTRSNIDLFCLISQYSQLEMLEYLIDQTELLPYLSTTEKAKQNANIKTTFLNCIYNGKTGLLEKFYDHWVGDLHWVINKISSKDDYENLKNLLSLMKEAYIEYKTYLNEESNPINPHIIVDVLCIITFNEFQIELYEKLNKEKDIIHKWGVVSDYDNTVREIQVIINIIEITINLHRKYSKEKFYEKFPLLSLLDDDENSVYRTAQKFYMFKNFFWKSDYNVCVLILDNLYLLKERLKMPNSIYQSLESKLYYFIYNCKSKWSFFLSQTEKYEVENIVAENDGIISILNTSFMLDVGALWTFLIMYLERENFLDMLHNFKEELKKPILIKNVRLNRSEMTDDEQQSLMPFPELRDDFSLKKMFRCLQELPQTQDIKQKTEWAQLIIERILQVVGEFIKSSKESKHLEATTQALMLAEIPIDVVNCLKDIRLFLSKSDRCQILWRIEIIKHGESVLEKVLQDLLHIKDVIKRIINVNRYLVNRSLIKCCFKVLHARRDCIEKDIADILHLHFNAVTHYLGGALLKPTQFHGNFLLENFYESHWKKTGLSVDLMMEIAQIQHDLNMLCKKQNQEKQRIKIFIDKNYSYYKQVITSLLDKIDIQKKNWTEIKLECQKTQDILISDYPNDADLSRVRNYLKTFMKNDPQIKRLTDLLNNVIDIDPLWNLIETIFNFLIMKCKAFDETVAEIKYGIITYFYKKVCQEGYKTDDMFNNVKYLLNFIEETGVEVNTSIRSATYKFDGIKEFDKILQMKQFITEDEMQYIIKNMPKSQCDKLQLSYMRKNFLTDMKYHIETITSILPFDKKSEEIVQSVNVKNRDPNLLKCYFKRLESLSTLLNGQPKDLLVLRYKYIGQFKIWLEMLLIDLFNILKKCNKVDNLRKSNKLLTEINLRHVLTHGNPLLEVVGEFLDANDVPGEIIGKSLEFIADLESVQALYELKETGFNFDLIYNNLDDFHNEHEKRLLETFRKSTQSNRYLFLLNAINGNPTKPKIKNKKKKTLITQESELINAINTKKHNEIKDIIGRVDVNLTDKLGKAAIHYAAIQGNVEILKLLVENKADINITNKKENNWTALHYATRKGHKNAMDLLITCGAEIKKDDQGDTYQDIEVKQKEIAKHRMSETKQSHDDFVDIAVSFESLNIENQDIECEQSVVSIDNVTAAFDGLNMIDYI